MQQDVLISGAEISTEKRAVSFIELTCQTLAWKQAHCGHTAHRTDQSEARLTSLSHITVIRGTLIKSGYSVDVFHE